MSAKKATQQVNASLYEGKLELDFPCIGVKCCPFALCPVMPPDGSEVCFFSEYSSCSRGQAQYVALKDLSKKIQNEMDRIAELLI